MTCDGLQFRTYSTHIPTSYQSWRKYGSYQSGFTRHMLSSNRAFRLPSRSRLMIPCFRCGFFFLHVGVADPKHNPLNPEGRRFSVRGFLPLATCFIYLKAPETCLSPLSLTWKHFQGHQNEEVWQVTWWQSFNLSETVGLNSSFYWWHLYSDIRITPRNPHQRLTPQFFPYTCVNLRGKTPVIW